MKKKLFSTISIGVLGVTFFANSYTTQAAPEHIKQVKHIELNTDEDEYTTKNAFAAGVAAGIVSAAVYDGIKAAGNWLGKQANKANAQSIYSAAPARKYACYIVNPKDHKDIDISEVAEFGR
ncbi:hypothetical protein MOF52_00875 [Bacillus inaquosorum]|uniref:hypothetical protein n=1 Tax=Bacillus inaquosorum TaxID=483913 RepID=UPI00227E0968|nr:hypothetical protein [Bacillus inaquosorum]MCY8056023.1 hypothetical protein [Bacillus inaquosorum]MCY9406607.1 hypothetical protein [Bacillus inaquosorum]MCY9416818.1 hypothetical protein [Bacillus inaquosorum]